MGNQVFDIIKKKLVTSLIIFFVISASVSAANGSGTRGVPGKGGDETETGLSTKLESAPLNPDFIKYQKNLNSTQKKTSLDGHKTGYIPPPVDLHHMSLISSEE
jgi:hypothetical protein